MGDRIFYSNRYSRKRGSFDSTVKPENTYKSKHRDSKKQIAELSIDLNPKKNLLSLHGKNHTHRIQKNDMCELREEVEQLRMENESLKQQLHLMKKNEEDLKYQVMRAKEEVYANKLKFDRMEYECAKMEEKVEKYSRKIKELFEQLIQEKKKVSCVGQESSNISRIRGAVSPSARSVKSNSLYYKQLQKQGERDYFSSLAQFQKHQFSQHNQMAWSIEHSQFSPAQNQGIPHTRQTFGTIF